MTMNQGGDLRRTVRPILGLAAIAMFVLLLPTAVSAAPEFHITIPIDTVVMAPEGSITELEPVIQVPAENQGQECSVVAHAQNQESVHPDNDLLVTSGSSQVVIPDVEAVPGGSVNADGILVLGTTIVVSLRMGPDEVFSAGIDVLVDCPPEATTTTTEPTTTTTSESTTTTAEATTTTTQASTTTVAEVTTTAVEDEVLPTQLTTTTIEDEVLDEEVLPFTGSSSGPLIPLAAALVVSGLLVVLAMRTEEDN